MQVWAEVWEEVSMIFSKVGFDENNDHCKISFMKKQIAK
jgi:hypothetical protein